jgi:hypothetical protein
MQLRLEYAILLYQVGDPAYRKEGEIEFKKLRQDLRERSGAMFIPDELRFLADPTTGFQKSLKTSFKVGNMTSVGKSGFGVPNGWGSQEVAFQPRLFPFDTIRKGKELDCMIQFSNFGPQAVPTGTKVDR